jgi:phenylalanyl-tRNA synthetase beta chain
VESIAGIMGGEASGCTEETVNVFLESAYWDPIHTAYTGRDLKINSDARYRFERGVDPDYTLPGLEAATAMVLELCGGEASEVVEAGAPVKTARAYPLDTKRVISLVGMEIPRDEQVRHPDRAGLFRHGHRRRAGGLGPVLAARRAGRARSCRRSRAHGLAHQAGAQADAAAEAGRARAGPDAGPASRARGAADDGALGYNECVTYSFIDEASAKLFGGGDDATRLENPISSEMSHMRPALLPGLLQAAARNQARGMMDLALFEVGHAFHGGEPTEQHLQAVGLLVGQSGPRDPHGARRPVDVFDVKADAEAVLSAMGAPAKAQILRGAAGWWHPGRHGMICLGPKKVLGIFGELHPRFWRRWT